MADDKTGVFGVSPPSTKSRLIPKSELQSGGDLYPVDGEVSQLNDLIGNTVRYVDVTVRRKDLQRVIKSYLDEVKLLRK